MSFKVEITAQAETELDEAYEWIANESPEKAVEWFNALVDAIQTLQNLPKRCALAPESETVGQEIRQLLYSKYRILFIIRENTVSVLHVRHGARQYLPSEGV